MEVILWIGRIIAVVALLCVAAAVATPPGRLPPALRALQRILRKDAGASAAGVATASPRASLQRRLSAFVLVLLAALIAMI